MLLFHRIASLTAAFALLVNFSPTTAQTYTSCNPVTQGGCPADTALGKAVNINFASGGSDEFTPSGAPTYDSNGAAFTVAKSGDSPLITSKWYIMFGHVDYVIRAAPGVGIVSSAVLQSDCLDEIDWEWLGGDNAQVQSNYFGKGLTTSYNRGAYHAASGNHDGFKTYSIDWTANQIVWSIDGETVRVLQNSQADPGQYPQTPMMIKVGAWSGGDSANPPGTVAWAGGPTDYSAGPFTMYLKSIAVSDYSTGSQYSYSGTGGTWQSIRSNGGTINTSGTPGVSPASNQGVTTTSPTVAGYTGTTSAYNPSTGWPWVGTATATLETATSSVPTTYSGLPSGWTVNSDGKVVPPNAAVTTNVPFFVLTFCVFVGFLMILSP